MRTAIIPILLILLLASPLSAHENHQAETTNQSEINQASQITYPKIVDRAPWTKKPLLNDPSRFQIAIMTDRTGGHRPGVWMDAVNKLNLLRPEFVVSVGDLIEGYTEDQNQVEKEWNEFTGFVDQLDMKFFFVAGNHDLTNPMMHRLWREKFGPEWYSFDYKDVHFLCLCSEDPVNRISDKQLEFIRRDLEASKDDRWTLVFIHKPLWTYAESQIQNQGQDRTNWKQVEELLVGRPHTVFAGHVHHYVQYERNENNYYSLATTGGGSSLRGNKYGEFDHVTWLTMEPSGPQVVNLRLDGILPPDVVTEKSISGINELLNSVSLDISPILVKKSSGFQQGTFELTLTNQLDKAVEVVGSTDGLPLRGLLVEPEELKLTVEPGGSAKQTIKVAFSEQIDFSFLKKGSLSTTISSIDKSGSSSIERTIPLVIDRQYECPLLADDIEIDGLFQPEPSVWYGTTNNPLVIGNSNDWKNADDAAIQVATAHTGKDVILSFQITDERVLAGKDLLNIGIDARSESTRRKFSRLRGGIIQLEVTAPDKEGNLTATATVHLDRRKRETEELQAAAVKTASGWDLEVVVPARMIDRFQGANQSDGWTSFQMAAAYTDFDEPDVEPAIILWRGSRNYRSNNTNYGQFVRGE